MMTKSYKAHIASNGNIRLYYEVFGPKDGAAVLLLTGAGRQGADFSDSFCERLAGVGLRVIRYDQRDTGLSSALTDQPSRLVDVYDAVKAGTPPPLVYGLEDLAADAFAVMDAEGVGAAHIVGRSLGSAVAQMMALTQLERVLSLSLIIAFSRSLADAMTREGLARIEAESFPDAEAYVARQVKSAAFVASPDYLDEARIAAEARVAFARGVHAGGSARHFAAGIGAPDMRPRLRFIRTPTLIIHGALDKVIPASFAQETAEALAGSRLEVMSDMAHDGPPELVARWAELLLEHIGQSRGSKRRMGDDTVTQVNSVA